MADITTISGIALQTGADRVYEVTSIVDVGSGIDDVTDAVFLSKSGGLLRWGAGCTTTFTNCMLIEQDDAATLPDDNFSITTPNSDKPRFNGGATCAPVFKGCTFIQNDDVGRSDWDVGTDCAPEFRYSDDGAPCQILIKAPAVYSEQFDHFISSNITIDGLIYQGDKADQALEFGVPPTTMSDLTVRGVDRVTLRMDLWSDSTTGVITALGADAIGLYNGNATKTCELVDPVGDILKYTGNAVFRLGVLSVYRTYTLGAIDASTQNSLNPTIVITATSDDDVSYDEALVAGSFSKRLYQYGQAYDSTVQVSDADYRRALVLYGYKPIVSTFTVAWDAGSPSGRNDGTQIMFADSSITESNIATVAAYTELETDAKLYDYVKRYEVVRTDRELAGDLIAEGAGTSIDFQANNVTFTNATPGGDPLTVSGSDITVYTDGNQFTTTTFNNLTTTGTITFSQSAVTPQNLSVTGDVVLSEVTDITNLDVSGSITMSTAGTYTFTDCTVGEVINTSGGAITINSIGSTITTNTGPNITITAASAPFTAPNVAVGANYILIHRQTFVVAEASINPGTNEITLTTDTNGDAPSFDTTTAGRHTLVRVILADGATIPTTSTQIINNGTYRVASESSGVITLEVTEGGGVINFTDDGTNGSAGYVFLAVFETLLAEGQVSSGSGVSETFVLPDTATYRFKTIHQDNTGGPRKSTKFIDVVGAWSDTSGATYTPTVDATDTAQTNLWVEPNRIADLTSFVLEDTVIDNTGTTIQDFDPVEDGEDIGGISFALEGKGFIQINTGALTKNAVNLNGAISGQDLAMWAVYQIAILDNMWVASNETLVFNGLSNIIIDNVEFDETSGNLLQIYGANIREKDGAPIVSANTTGAIVANVATRGNVGVVESGTSGLTASESAELAKISAVKSKTDSLTFTQSGQVDSNVKYVHDIEVDGTGTTSDPWGPA